MKRIFKIGLVLLILKITSCGQTAKNRFSINPKWIKYDLPNKWVFYAPPNFTVKKQQGIDSQPGTIFSKEEGLYLNFDSGTEIIQKNNCDFKQLVSEAKQQIDTGFYKQFYKIPINHTAYIDTIDNKIAIIIKPVKVGEGEVHLSISDCKNGFWLGITGTKLAKSQEALVLEIFKSIQLIKE